MFKKGLVTLVCLTVMSALWAWATTTYSISTKITSLGSTLKAGTTNVYEPIIGGDIKVRDGVAQTTGIKYSNFTTSALIDVVVTPKSGYKISALTATGAGVHTLPAVGANQTAALTVQIEKPAANSVGTAAWVVATFAPAGDTPTESKNWQLQVLSNTPGGSMKIARAGSLDVNYTTYGKTLLKSYVDTTPVTVTVTPASGYNIDYLIVNGVKSFYKTGAVQTVNVDPSTGSRIKSVVAGFQKKSLKVTTQTQTVTTPTWDGGSVTRPVPNGIEPANPVADPTGTVRLVVTPFSDVAGVNYNTVQSFDVTSGSYGSISYADRFGKPLPDGLPFTGPVKVTITGITSDITVAASYGLDVTKTAAYANCTQTCHADTNIVPQSVRDADTQWLSSKHAYNEHHTVDCVGCHQTMPGREMTKAVCAECHKAPYAPHLEPAADTAYYNAGNACLECHNHAVGTAAGYKAPHYAGTVLVRAQYMAQNVTCSDCHAGSNAAALAGWAKSGHGNVAGDPWYHYDWASSSRAACAPCHTTTGYLNSLPGATPATMTAGQAAQVLTCEACHSDTAAGTVRTPGAFTLTTGTNAQTATFADVAASNLCVRCHAGRETGASITADPSTTGVRSFINSHYLAAAGTLFGKTGYHYAGQTYPAGYHQNVGVSDAYGTGNAGPCVACHMSSSEAHTFEVSAASATCANCHGGLTDEVLEASKHEFHLALEELNGALKAQGIHFYPAHPYFYTAPYVVGYKETGACSSNLAVTNWNKNGTNIYKATYKTDGSFDKCVLDTENPAYVAGDVSSWKGRMGAAFNYNLLDHDPGAFAHNRGYGLKLIQDSIDYLADGAVNGTGASAVVAAVMADESFAAATSHPDAVVAAPTPSTTCADCHTPAPHYGGQPFHQAQYVSSAVSCANCHSTPANATAYQAVLAQYADSAHAAKDAEAWIHFDWRSGSRSACARCHNGTAFVAKLADVNDTSNVFAVTDILKPGESLSCSACHTDAGTGALRTAAQDFSQQFTVNMKNGATATYNVAGASSLCARCHSGRETGDSIKADSSTEATGLRVFVDSHYQPVTGIVYNNGGYEYAGQTYDNPGGHKTLGAAGQGPCVTCHMPGKNHSFAAASCVTCHATMNATAMKADYDTALGNLKTALAAKGIHYGPVHPFFFTSAYVEGGVNTPFTAWGSVYGAASWKDTMGAAFNYNMLWSDKGAFAHNYGYAMKLIADSINFISDGSL